MTSQERRKRVDEIDRNFTLALKGLNIEISENVNCEVDSESVAIKVLKNGKIKFNSEIKIYYSGQIVIPSSTINDDEDDHWKFIHVTSILKNKQRVINLVRQSCDEFRNFVAEVMQNEYKN